MRRVENEKPVPQRPRSTTFCLVWCPARPTSATTQQRSEHVGHLKYALCVPFPAIPPVVSGKVAQTAHPQRARRVVLMSIVGKLYLITRVAPRRSSARSPGFVCSPRPASSERPSRSTNSTSFSTLCNERISTPHGIPPSYYRIHVHKSLPSPAIPPPEPPNTSNLVPNPDLLVQPGLIKKWRAHEAAREIMNVYVRLWTLRRSGRNV